MKVGAIRRRVAAPPAAARMEDRRLVGAAVALADRRAAQVAAGPAGNRLVRS